MPPSGDEPIRPRHDRMPSSSIRVQPTSHVSSSGFIIKQACLPYETSCNMSSYPETPYAVSRKRGLNTTGGSPSPDPYPQLGDPTNTTTMAERKTEQDTRGTKTVEMGRRPTSLDACRAPAVSDPGARLYPRMSGMTMMISGNLVALLSSHASSTLTTGQERASCLQGHRPRMPVLPALKTR